MTNEATASSGNSAVENPGHRPSDLMVRYDETSANAQNAASPEAEGQPSVASGTEQVGTQAEDVPAGLNPNSPEYRHFQSLKDKEVAKAKAEAASEADVLKARLAELENRLSATELQQTRSQSGEQENRSGLAIPWDQAPRFQAPDGSYLDEAAGAAVQQYVTGVVDWTIQQIQAQQLAVAQQQSVAEAEGKLVSFAQGIAPEAQVKFIGLVQQYQQVARQDPERFLKFAKVELGMIDRPAESQPAPQKPAAAQTQALPSSRPTNNAPVRSSYVDQNASFTDKIAQSVRQHLNGG